MNLMSNLGKFLIIISIVLAWGSYCQAGFGISPPAVHNPDLLRGSHYEQTILLIRGEPKEDLRAELTIAAPENPEIIDWITIEQGTSFILPKGISQFPMKVKVDVPKDAAYKTYNGYIDVKTIPAVKEAGVAVALGARINVVLGVTNRPAPNFKVRSAEIPEVVEGCPVKYILKIENIGNVKTRPAKIEIKIFHGYATERLLETSEVKAEDLAWTEAFKTKTIVAKFPVKLEATRYWAETKIFKDGEVIREDKTFFSVAPAPKILGFTIGPCNYSLFTIVGIIVLAVFGAGIYYEINKRRRLKKKL